jgi:hypothetical protein
MVDGQTLCWLYHAHNERVFDAAFRGKTMTTHIIVLFGFAFGRDRCQIIKTTDNSWSISERKCEETNSYTLSRSFIRTSIEHNRCW